MDNNDPSRSTRGTIEDNTSGSNNNLTNSPPTMQPLQAQPIPASAGSSIIPRPAVQRAFQPALGVSPIHYRPRPPNAIAGPGPSSVAASASTKVPAARTAGMVPRPITTGRPAGRPAGTQQAGTVTTPMGSKVPGPKVPARPNVPTQSTPVSTPTNPHPAGSSSTPSTNAAHPRPVSPRSSSNAESPSTTTTTNKKRKLDPFPTTSTHPQSNPSNGQTVGISQDSSTGSQYTDKDQSRPTTGDGGNGTAAPTAAGAGAGERDKDGERESKRKKKESKKEAKKARACIYCRRSHMVCDATRPCTRCNKRGIEHLCIADAKSAGYELDPSKPGEVYHLVGGDMADHEGGSGNGQGIGGGSGSGNGNGHGHGNGNGNGNGSRVDVDTDDVDDRIGATAGKTKKKVARKVKMADADGADNGDPATHGRQWNGQSQRADSFLEESSPDESGTERISQRDAFVQSQQGYLGGEPSESIYAAGVSLPPSMALHPAWPLLPNNSTVASIPDDSEPSMSTFGWDHAVVDVGTGQGQGRTTPQNLDNSTAMHEFFESLGIPNLPGGIGDIFGMSTNRFEGPPDTAGLPIISSASNPNVFARTSVTASSGSVADPTVIGMRMFGDGNDALRNPPLFTPREQEADIKPILRSSAFDSKAEDDGYGFSGGLRKATFMDSGEPLLGKVSKAEKYLLAAADQASGTRDERLAQVIKAKYDAGLLKPYDYSRSYARFYRWMEKNVTPATKQAILRPLSVFRPAFRAIAQSLSDIDLVFVEEAFERLMLDYDRVFSAIHTPSCLWRRTGEIYKANKEFSVLTGIPTAWLRGGRVGIYQLMTEESLLQYYELLGSMAFDSGRRSVNTTCTLRIPAYLTRTMNPQTPLFGPTGSGNPSIPIPPATASTIPSASPVPHGNGTPLGSPMQNKPGSGLASAGNAEGGFVRPGEYSTVRCCFSFTIRRDSWGIPTAIIGNWIPL